jgi:hypothetical protein
MMIVWTMSGLVKQGESTLEAGRLLTMCTDTKRPDDLPADIEDYRVPNESGQWSQLRKKLTDPRVKSGVVVSVGTERCFVDLLLCEKATGLICVDTSLVVKRYIDFNVLALRLAHDRTDYKRILGFDQPDRIRERISEAERAGSLAQKLITYYEDSLEILLDAYRSVQDEDNFIKWWTDTTECLVNYREDDTLFKRVQSFACDGNIIAVVRNINELQFIDRPIAVVDISNVQDYILIDVKTQYRDVPVLWATGQPLPSYNMYVNRELPEAERENAMLLVRSWAKTHPDDYWTKLDNLYAYLQNNEMFVNKMAKLWPNDDIIGDSLTFLVSWWQVATKLATDDIPTRNLIRMARSR